MSESLQAASHISAPTSLTVPRSRRAKPSPRSDTWLRRSSEPRPRLRGRKKKTALRTITSEPLQILLKSPQCKAVRHQDALHCTASLRHRQDSDRRREGAGQQERRVRNYPEVRMWGKPPSKHHVTHALNSRHICENNVALLASEQLELGYWLKTWVSFYSLDEIQAAAKDSLKPLCKIENNVYLARKGSSQSQIKVY